MKNLTINKAQKLYVISHGAGYTCLGFKNCFDKATKLNIELGYIYTLGRPGTIKLYKQYQILVDTIHNMNIKTGYQSNADLIPEFIGKEGKRVEIITNNGTKERFIIGKSTGWIPCHLMIKTKRSNSGGAVYGYPFKSITFLD